METVCLDVDQTTVTKWGGSSAEVKKNLDHMKQTAAKKLAEMTETVRSYSQSMYNVMTKKWESMHIFSWNREWRVESVHA